MNILITGGAGYIGSHVVRQALHSGHNVVVIDNLSTGHANNLPKGTSLVEADFADTKILENIFLGNSVGKVDAVMHFAASIDLNESIKKPLEYFDNNTIKTAILIQEMLRAGVKNFIFSSTAAVYGKQEIVPIPEVALGVNLAPYGLSKKISEDLIKAYCDSAGLRAIIFRYFNVAGSEPGINVRPSTSTSLIPSVLAVASGKAPNLVVYGNDYDTIDGTAVRDYVHVLDIARAHMLGLESLAKSEQSIQPDDSKGVFKVYNIGTGIGWSVKQVITATERVTGKTVPIHIADRRPVDVPIALADNSKIKSELNFELLHSDLDTLIKTSWR